MRILNVSPFDRGNLCCGFLSQGLVDKAQQELEAAWLTTWAARALVCALLLFFSTGFLGNAEAAGGGRIADGELHACQAVTVDQAWAVGDRGLILATNDAGKTWTIQNQRSDMALHALHFANLLQGWVVGGTIDPNTGRSSGTVLATTDGGTTWQTTVSNLPRLTGMQYLGPDHLLAWGDWSNLYQSSLFESMDGGKSWSSRPVPCSHIQAAAADVNGTLVLVDRTGRGYRTGDGTNFQPLSLPLSPLEPIRFCKWIEGVWWLGGDAGHLYRSQDGAAWKKCVLPGIASDHQWLSLRDIAVIGKKGWVVGNPGNVIWTTEDQGDTWSVRKTDSATMNRAVSALNADVLMTCGSFASIRASRNGGKAWWSLHQSGSRASVLNIASTSSSIAWDLLAQVAFELRRTTSIVVIHDQLYEKRMGLEPDLESRVAIAGSSIGASPVRMMPQFPVGNILSGVRAMDVNYYAARSSTEAEQASSAMLRALVFELRTLRPDVLVTDCSETGMELERLSSNAIDASVRLAADPHFRLFSEASGIPEDAWQPQRTIVRGTRAGLVYSQAMLFKSTGVALGQILLGIQRILDLKSAQDEPSAKIAYRFLGSKSGSMRDPLEGVLNDPATQLNERSKPSVRLAALMATCQLYDYKQMFLTESSSKFTTDRVWEGKIKGIAKDASPQSVCPALLEIAIQSRREGDWQRWHTALDLALSISPNKDVTESILAELMSYLGSAEVQQVVAGQIRAFEEHLSQDKNDSIVNVQQASPFARSENESDAVKTVSFHGAIKRVPIATDRSLNEFVRLLGQWPSDLHERRAEPSWGWLIASRYRAMQMSRDGSIQGVNLERSPATFWPLVPPHLMAWNYVAETERNIQRSREQNARTIHSAEGPNTQQATTQRVTTQRASSDVQGIPPWSWTNQRPFLDGNDDETFWENATVIALRDPWIPSQESTTTLRMARDSEFLYIFSRSPFLDRTGKAVPSSQNMAVHTKLTDQARKPTDNVRAGHDQVRLRLDIDRDYATWFELGWTSTGEKSESCNDMDFWNPTWFVATLQEDEAWTTEIAIPLAELVGANKNQSSSQDWGTEVWAINAIRSIPSIGVHTTTQSISDRFSEEEWLFINMAPPISSP